MHTVIEMCGRPISFQLWAEMQFALCFFVGLAPKTGSGFD